MSRTYIQELRAKGITLAAVGEQLRISAAKGTITPDLAAQLKQRKPEILEALRQEDALRTQRVVARADASVPTPLSFQQQRLWFIDQFNGPSAVYNISTAFRVHGELDAGALLGAFATIIDRHEALRSRIRVVDGVAMLVVEQALDNGLACIDRPTPAAQRDAVAMALYREQDQIRFDLGGRLFDIRLYRFDRDDHLLLINVHHLVFDGWSSGVMVRELAALYTAAVSGTAAQLPELTLQYGDYAAWQRQQIDGGAWDGQLAYWREQLRDLPPLLELPLDRPRPPLQRNVGATHALAFGRDFSRSLDAFCKRNGVSAYMTVLAAFMLVLGRYARQDDVAVGTMIANRNRGELEGLIGFFANTLVLRSRIDGAQPFLDYVQDLRRTVLEAFEHQDTPFEHIVEALQTERTGSHTPLFQVMFVWQGASAGELDLAGLRFSDVYRDSGQSKFDLTLTLTEGEDGVGGGLQYNTDLFDPESVQAIAASLLQVLGSVVADPAQRLLQIALVDPARRAALLPTPAHIDGARVVDADADDVRATVHGRFAAACAADPQAIAIRCGERSLSYAEIDGRSDRIARRLRDRGVGRGDRVALFLDRSAEAVIAMLATLKAGACYVPVDPTGPRERLRHILTDSGAAALLTRVGHLPDYERIRDGLALDPPVIDMDDAGTDDAGDAAASAPLPRVGAQDPAYVIYTSGSTGKPKGSVIPHGNVVRLFDSTRDWFDFGPADVWSFFHSYAFDFSVWEIWGALLYGGRVVVVPYATSRNPADFHALLAEEGVTVLNQTPSAFLQLMHADGEAPAAQREALRLRYAIFGGEALDIPALRPWFERHGDRHPRLINMYGITETTVHVTYREIDAADAGQSRSLIGEPIPDLQLYLLDADMEPVPTGVLGEIHVGGAGLAQMYLNRAELTADRFVPHPFSPAPGQRLYRTGDLARRTRDGELEYAGRSDEQVKIRGFRIELGEIEHAIASLPWVERAIVRLLDTPPHGRRLVAYIAARDGHDAPDNAQLHAQLRNRLPDYMVPAAYVRVSAFKLTENGKIDYRALPASEGEAAPRQAYAEPRNDTERRLLAVWSQVLGVAGIGIDDNYFVLGGDSIRSIQLIAAARAAGLDFSLQHLFAHQTVAELAPQVRVDASRDQATTQAPFALIDATERAQLPDDVEDAYPLSSLQAGMIYHSLANPDQGHYHNVSSLKITGCPMRPALFEQALERVTARHPILRTSFHLDEHAAPLQWVHRHARAQFEFSDLSALDEAARDAAAERLIAAQKRTPFDLAHAPLYRIFVQQAAPDRFQITWVDHHAILDGWSVASFFTEVFEQYFHLIDGRPLQSPPLRSFYRDFVAAERAALADADARRHWAATIDDAPFLALPKPQGTGQAEEDFRHAVSLPEAMSDALRDAARTLGVPVRTVLLAAHLKVLSMLAGQQDVLTGVVNNGRIEEDDGERCLGLFLNTLPLRVGLAPGAAWAALVADVFAAEQALLAHRRFPLAEIQRMNGGDPLFDIAFNFISFHVLRRMDDGVPAGFQAEQREQFQRNSFALMCGFRDDPGSREISLDLQYDPERLDREQVVRAGRCYARVLAALTGSLHARHDDDGLLADEDLAIVRDWEDGGEIASAPGSFDTRFAAQCLRTPDAMALDANGTRLTYAELDRRVSALAAQLIARGVGEEARIAICLPRDAQLPIAMLAVARAGGGYVPLDPQYPDSRLAYILDDAEPLLVLTHSSLLPKFDAARHALLCVDTLAPAGSPQASSTEVVVPPAAAAPLADGISHIIYTSGSTGQPKGVSIRRSSTAAMLDWAVSTFGANAFERTLASTSICFDLSVFELFAPLSCGGCVVLVDSMLELATRDVGAVSLVNTVPSALNAILDAGRLPPGVRIVNVAGEPLPRTLVDKAYAVDGVEAVYNLYGPSEDTTYSTFARIPRGNGEKPSIGRPLSGTRAHVLDAALNRVAPGSIGELYLSGLGLGRGYWARAGLTAERFLPCPYADEPGARMYRTGDLVRFRADGELDFLGRVDHQVKVRGFRIELGEIEHVLAARPGVAACAAMVQEHAPGQLRVVAYASAQAGGMLEERALIDALRVQLPEYMVPARIVVLERMPATPNGKIDRKALPPVIDETAQTRVGAPPVGEIECLLAQVWGDALGHAVDERHANFFGLGGDSILSIQVVARMRRLGFDLTPRKLFEHPSLAELARNLTRADDGAMVCEQGDITGDVMLTPVQRWFFAQRFDRQHHWNQAVALEVGASCSREHVATALQALLAHHDMLRARFDDSGDGAWRQTLPAQAAVDIDVVELGEPGSAQAQTRWREAADAAQASLRLQDGQVLRAVWGRYDGGRNVLLLVAHHLVVDAVSWRILLEDLDSACAMLSRGEPVRLPPKTTSFRHWAQRLAAHAGSDALAAEADYWRAVAAAPVPALPRDRDGRNDVASSRNCTVALDAAQTRALLRDVPAAFNTEINDVLLTALAQAVGAWTGAGICGLTLEGHGREDLFDDADLSRTVGWFTTMYPLALRIDAEAGIEADLKSIKEQLRAVPGKGLGYGLLRYLDPRTAAELDTVSAHADIGFNYLGQFDTGAATAPGEARFSGAAEPPGALHAPSQLRSHVLDVTGMVSGGSFTMNWTYSANLHDAATIQSLADAFLDRLRALIAHCVQDGTGGRTPSDFPLIAIPQAELDAIVADAPDGASGIEDIYPATPLQQGLLYHSVLDAEAGAYLIQMSYEVVGDFDAAAFFAAWNHVLSQHAILRTTFVDLADGTLAQVVRRNATVPSRQDDWSALPADRHASAWNELMARDRATGFDFAVAPLLRLHLVRTAQAAQGEERHRFLLTYHHALLDGWSIPLLLNELFDAYDRASRGQPLQIARGRPFRDYMHWLQRQPRDRAIAYWRDALAGVDEPTRLHAATPAEGLARADFGTRRRRLPPALFAALDRLVRDEGLTLNIVMQAAWALVLSLHSARSDVVFGVTTSGRPSDLADAGDMIGLFINTVPARVRVPGDLGVLGLLRGMHADQVVREEHAYLPLTRIQSLSGVRGDTPLFDSLVVFENYPVSGPAEGGDASAAQANLIETHEQANYPLSLCIVPGSDGLMVNLNHDRRFHDDAASALLLDRYQRALEQIVACTHKPLAAIDLLADDERAALARWSRGEDDRDGATQSFLQRVARIAREHGGRPAVVEGVRSIDYARLERRSNRLARHLQARGVRRGDRVAVLLERGIDAIAAMLAILKAGAVYLPIDPAYPDSRVRMILDDAAPVAMLARSGLRADIAGAGRIDLDLIEDALAAGIDDDPISVPATAPTPDDPAYMIYTSGSTGRPKGAVLTHRGLANVAITQARAFAIDEHDRMLQFASIGFDASVWEISIALVAGAALHVVTDEERRLGAGFAALLERDRPTWATLPPSLLRNLDPRDFPELRTLISAGEACDADIVRRWSAGRDFHNAYGPSETSICATRVRYRDSSETPSIGAAIANMQVHVLDADLRPLPPGVPGEIWVGGVGLAQCYWNRPDLTAASFAPDPFATEPGARLYRTGDLGRYRSDGGIDFLGRVDHQVKVRGFRIELAEIEARLLAQDGIADAVVVARADAAGGTRLHAYVAGGGAAIDVRALRMALREQLPDYMVPARMIALDTLPLNVNGKVDRDRLAEHDAPDASGEDPRQPLSTATEHALAAIWRDVLQVAPAGAGEDFFEVGGNSLAAMQVVSRIREALLPEIGVDSLYRYPCLGDLARYIDTQRWVADGLQQHAEERADEQAEPVSGAHVFEDLL